MQKSKNQKVQKSKNKKIKKNARFRRCKKVLDFWIFRFFGFLDFCVLHLCFQTVETAPKLDSEKTAFVSVFTVFLRGVRVVGGGYHIQMFIYSRIYVVVFVCKMICWLLHLPIYVLYTHIHMCAGMYI